MPSNIDTLVTVFGGSGFIGRHTVRALAKRDYRIRVAVRRPDLAGHLQPLGRVGQIMPVQANVRYPDLVAAAVRDAQIVVNLVGVLAESGAQTFNAVQAEGAAAIARAAAAQGARLVHVSAIGADENSESGYARSKAAGEKAVFAAVPSATIFRPSVVFGPDDQFTNRFAALARALPVLPLIGGGETKLQPVFVGDAAVAIADAVEGKARSASVYELGGPEELTMRQVLRIRAEDDRAQAAACAAVVRSGEAAGDGPAVCAGTIEADARSGRAAAQRQRRLAGGKGCGADAAGAGHRTCIARADRAVLSLALPPHGAVPHQDLLNVISGH